MALDLQQELKEAHALLDQLPPAKLGAVRSLLEVMVDDEGEEEADVFSPEDIAKIQASREYFRQGGQGISLEQAVAECGFTMEQITGEQLRGQSKDE
jgi:hypothetical protein